MWAASWEYAMSLMTTLKNLFAGAPAGVSDARDANRTYVIDAEKLAETREGQGGRVGPQERFQSIQALSRFAEREKIGVVAVLGGRPLREVAHGDAYNGVRVFYIEADKTMADQLQRVLDREVRGRAVVVTNDKQFEVKLAGHGVPTLRVTSLRRALENNGNGEGGGDGGGRNRDRGERGGRDRRNRGPRPERTERPDRANAPAEGSSAPAVEVAPSQNRPSRPSDTIDNLIDRVD